jgi:hypothetical protein
VQRLLELYERKATSRWRGKPAMSLPPYSSKHGLTERIQMDRVHTDENELAKQRLFTGLYHELHRLAQRALRRDGRLLPISVTTLLHESYLSVSKADFTDSQRFLTYAARTMRGSGTKPDCCCSTC